MNGNYDAIIVGAGYGGTACAALLAKEGIRVLVIDKNRRIGGKAMTLEKDGFRYELWPITGGPSLNSRFASVLRDLGMSEEVTLLYPDGAGMLMYRGRSGEYNRMVTDATPKPGRDPMEQARFLELEAADLPEVARFYGDMMSLSADEIDALDDVTLAEFMSRYHLPQPIWSNMGMWSNIVFVVPLDLLAASEAIRTYRDFAAGGAMRYSAGGFGATAEAFAAAVQRFGGDLLLGERVESIMVEDGAVTGVRTERGAYQAPLVVSNAGIQPTVLRLVGEQHFDRSYVNYVRGLVPSYGIIGVRYFLDAPVFDHGMFIAFADDNYVDTARFAAIRRGELPEELLVFVVVPAAFDPALAPPGKQVALVSTLASADAGLGQEDVLERLERTADRLWPEMRAHVESAEPFTTTHVSNLSRDHVLQGQGGECVGLAQIVGQCGRHKPSARAPLGGLFFVGCDAGGYGCGTHQAVDSGANVAQLVEREHRARSMRA